MTAVGSSGSSRRQSRNFQERPVPIANNASLGPLAHADPPGRHAGGLLFPDSQVRWQMPRSGKRISTRASLRAFLLCLPIALGVGQVRAGSLSPAEAAQLPQPSTIEYAHGILDKALSSRNPETRAHAVQALGLVGAHQPYQTELAAMLMDKDVDVRIATVLSLADLKDSSTVPALRSALDDPAPEVGFAAAKALWAMNRPEGRDALFAVVAGDRAAASGYVKSQAREAVHAMHTPRILFDYILHFGIGLAHVPGLGTGISSAEGILSDQNVSGRAAALLLLSTDNDPRVLPALRAALSDEDASVRSTAVHALALRNDRSLEAAIEPLLADKDRAVQLRAAAACLRLELLPTPRPAARVRRSKKKAVRRHRAPSAA